MATYYVVCKTMGTGPSGHQHIVSVGVTLDRNTYKATQTLTVSQVVSMLSTNTFKTHPQSTVAEASVTSFHCRPCNRTYITTRPDATTEDNLLRLPSC